MITDYAPQVFDELNQFQIAKSKMEKSRDALPELGAVICKYNLQQKIGLALMHKHFDLMSDERLIEHSASNTVNITPVSNPDDNAIIPHTFKLALINGAREQSWFPLEYQYKLEATHDSFKTAEILKTEPAFLQDMAIKLKELDLGDVFGISILHREAVALQEGQLRLETTNHQARLLTVAAVDRDSIEAQDITETLWYFTADSDFEVSGMCGSHCYSHCSVH